MTTNWTEPRPLPNGPDTVIAYSEGAGEGPLPVLYLLHGQFDWETDWWDEQRGQLNNILAAVQPGPMLLVAPRCIRQRLDVRRNQLEPDLTQFVNSFPSIQAAVRAQNGGSIERQAILGISMGGKQALAIVLTHPGEYDALGVLSPKLQGENYNQLARMAPGMNGFAANTGLFYYHYCGALENGRLGPTFVPNNRRVATAVGGGNVMRDNPQGLHNWTFWRPEVQEFMSELAALWS